MIRGLKPINRKDPRTLDWHRTFGVAVQIPPEFNFDTLNVFPDQNSDGFPNACTAYTVCGNASNDDKNNYDDKDFTYSNTKLMMGVSGDVPCDQMTAMKSGTVYGVKTKGETPDQALIHRRAPYFIVRPTTDYFDGLISAMWTKQGTLNVGSYWPPECEQVGSDGLVPSFSVPKNWNVGHNYEVCGVKDGRIMVKSWQGNSYGDKGYCYLNRTQINDLLGAKGSGAFGQKHASPEDIRLVKMSIIETIISLIQMWIEKINLGKFFGSRTFGATRSPKWDEVRREHLKTSPLCVICGNKKVNVHHIKPFHIFPDLELVQSNLITLCDGLGTHNHHIEFGHFFSWKSWNENVVADTQTWNTKISTRP